MSTRTSRRGGAGRRSAFAGAVLAVALTLAGCGGGDDESTDSGSPEPPEAQEVDPPEDTSEAASDDDATAGEDSASDDATSEDEADSASPGEDADDAAADDEADGDAGADGAGEGTPAGIDPVSLTWPAEWISLTHLMGATPSGAELEMFGISETEVYPGGVLTVYSPEFVAGQSFEEMVAAEGAPAEELVELEPREVAGQTVTPLEVDLTPHGLPATQRFYPLELEGGGMAAITLTSPVDVLAEAEPLFDQILASVTIED
ncbi:hypothetical protein [Georgenia sp. Z1491]|uniref:hypothetical protein n=1 Tax=Georgenia sp. Z1491 TaxID=3416707 RepID=UPI003CE8EB19